MEAAAQGQATIDESIDSSLSARYVEANLGVTNACDLSVP